MRLLLTSLFFLVILIACNIHGMMFGGQGSFIWLLLFVICLLILIIIYFYSFYRLLVKFEKNILIAVLLITIYFFLLFISPILFGPIVHSTR